MTFRMRALFQMDEANGRADSLDEAKRWVEDEHDSAPAVFERGEVLTGSDVPRVVARYTSAKGWQVVARCD